MNRLYPPPPDASTFTSHPYATAQQPRGSCFDSVNIIDLDIIPEIDPNIIPEIDPDIIPEIDPEGIKYQ